MIFAAIGPAAQGRWHARELFVLRQICRRFQALMSESCPLWETLQVIAKVLACRNGVASPCVAQAKGSSSQMPIM